MYMLCCFRIFVKEQMFLHLLLKNICSLKLLTVVQRTIDIGSKFHCTIWCADRMKIDTRPYWFEFVCNGNYVKCLVLLSGGII